jgi:hypothetical protein
MYFLLEMSKIEAKGVSLDAIARLVLQPKGWEFRMRNSFSPP